MGAADTERAFLLALRLTGEVQRAAAAIGRSPSVCYQRRDRRPDFAAAWAGTVADTERERVEAAQAATGATGEPPAPAMLRTRRDGWTQQRQRAFCQALADTGTVAAAAARVGLSRESALRLRRRSPAFRAACQQALVEGGPSLHEAVRARAIEGWDEPVFNGGVVVGHRRRFSDALVRLAREHERATAAATWGRGARPAAATPEQTDASILRTLASMAR
ncbi:hypothetical protein [uncultured Sphingomonas sp.]|uniref:hypothetical protein n=1 Tax=uncultured Sphingomonas sp. TaxID=158754 RepID=UPI0035CAFFE1